MIQKATKVQLVLHGIMEKFKTADVPKAVAYSFFSFPGMPSDRWSFMNRMITYMSGTIDARGIRQWNRVGRSVKPGSRAIYILVPHFVKRRDHEDDESEVLRGFMAKPVFRAEDTEGEPLDYEKVIPVPELPLLEKAEEWGLAVSTIPACKKFYGAYLSDIRKIVIATDEEVVFFHELSHAAYELSIGELRPGQNWDQEIIAELSAQALCHMVGKRPRDTMGNSYRYIEHHARSANLRPVTACLKVIDDVERVLNFILGKEVKTHVEHPNERAA